MENTSHIVKENDFTAPMCTALNAIESYLTMINQNLEESVHEKNTICKNAAAIKKNRLTRRKNEKEGRRKYKLFNDKRSFQYLLNFLSLNLCYITSNLLLLGILMAYSNLILEVSKLR